MYWFRSGNWLNIIPWMVVMLLVFWGGWLLVQYVFKNEKPGNLFLGITLGMVIYLWLINVLGRWIEPETVFYLSGILVLLMGLIASRGKPKLPNRDIIKKSWPYLILWVAMFWVFIRIGKGIGLYDEYKNLALISVIANGEIPVREVVGLSNPLRYHYGFHFLPASMMQLGKMMPWSAFDAAKAMLWGLAAVLSWLLGKEIFKKDWGGALAFLTVLFSGGTRYLLLLLPGNILIQGNDLISLTGSSAESAGNFFELMTSQLLVDSGPPVHYLMAYLSGIKSPLVLGHAGNSLMSAVVMLLVVHLLLNTSKIQPNIWTVGVLGVVLSFWGLASETAYTIFLIGAGIYIGWTIIRNRTMIKLDPYLVTIVQAVLVSLPIVIFQGGTISSMLLTQANNFNLIEAAQTGSSFSSFSVRWPPVIFSAHLGQIPLNSWIGWLIGLFEMGVWVLLLPMVTFWKGRSEGEYNRHLFRIFVIVVWFSLLFPMFMRWEWERDIVRIPTFGLEIFSILLLFYLADQLGNRGRRSQILTNATLLMISLTVYGGLVLMSTQLTASQQVILSHRYETHDGELLSKVWGKIPEESKTFGPIGKMSILTGNLTGGIYNPPIGEEREIWNQLMEAPTISGLVMAGYTHVYADLEWMTSISEDSVREFDNNCVEILAETKNESGSKFTRIYDISECSP